LWIFQFPMCTDFITCVQAHNTYSLQETLLRSPFFSEIAQHHWAIGAQCCQSAKWSLLDGSKCPLKRCEPFKEKTSVLSSNICNLSPSDKAPCARRTETSTTPLQKPKNSHIFKTPGLNAHLQPLQKSL